MCACVRAHEAAGNVERQGTRVHVGSALDFADAQFWTNRVATAKHIGKVRTSRRGLSPSTDRSF